MKTIYVAFYKGKSFWPSRLIRWITWSDYSHVAVQFPDENGVVYEAWASGIRCVASLSAQHQPGTSVDIFTIEVDQTSYDLIIQALQSKLGNPYDWTGVFRFFAIARLFMSKDPTYSELVRWFCSEYVAWAFFQGFVRILNKPFWKQSPADQAASPELTYLKTITTEETL